MVRSLYKSADMEDDLSITLQLMGGLRHMRGHFGVVFRPEGSLDLALMMMMMKMMMSGLFLKQ